MAFQHGLSGINAASKQLDAIGNNVANSSTVGFKGSRAEFADMFAANFYGVAATQNGIGVNTTLIAQQFGQGNITTTGNQLDMAISGNGFFVMQNANGISYTRNGQFQIDREGYINNGGDYLMGWAVDDSTNPPTIQNGNLQPLRVDNSLLVPRPSDFGGLPINVQLNLDSRKNPIGTVPSYEFVAGSTTGTPFEQSGKVKLPDGNFVIVDPKGTPAPTLGALFDAAGVDTKFLYSGNMFAFGDKLFSPTGPTVESPKTLLPAGDNQGLITADPEFVNSEKIQIGTTPNRYLVFTNDGSASTYDANGNKETPQLAVTDNFIWKDGEATKVYSSAKGVELAGGAAEVSFNPNDPKTYTSTTSLTAYDSLGNPIQVSVFQKKLGDGRWEVFATAKHADGSTVDLGTGQVAKSPYTALGNIQFSTDGKLINTGALNAASYTPPGGGAALNLKFDLGGTTQFGTNFAVNQIVQPGYASAVVTNMVIDKTGIVSAKYSNGQNKVIGQVVLANFANQQGLQSIGNNRWIETYASGTPTRNDPGSTNVGLIQSQALEDSNVDLTGELVNMITAQRYYQANAQTIKVHDQVLQSLMQMR